MTPSRAFIERDRNLDRIEVRHRPTAKEIAARIMSGQPPVPAVMLVTQKTGAPS